MDHMTLITAITLAIGVESQADNSYGPFRGASDRFEKYDNFTQQSAVWRMKRHTIRGQKTVSLRDFGFYFSTIGRQPQLHECRLRWSVRWQKREG